MKKTLYFLTAIMLLSVTSALAQPYPKICPDDKYDNVNNLTYNVVELEGLCWTKENLRGTLYAHGGDIPFAKTYIYMGVPMDSEIFGLLYTWYSATGVLEDFTAEITCNMQGICPMGWRLPTQAEWHTLRAYSAQQLMSSEHWLDFPGDGKEESGFSAIPAGWYNSTLNRYQDLYGFAGWWASNTPAGDNAYYFYLTYYCDELRSDLTNKMNAMSVRCVMCPDYEITGYTPASKEVNIIGAAPLTTTLTVTPNTDPKLFTYQWYNSLGIIDGATAQSYVASVSDTYYCVLSPTSGCPEIISEDFTVSIITINLTSAGTENREPCINTLLAPITFAVIGATGASVSDLPDDVSYTFSANTLTISGTATELGVFNYAVTLTDGINNSGVGATGTITVTPDMIAGDASSTPALGVGTVLTAITHATTGATGIGAATDLPTGVSATWADNTITISGTPTALGIFNYTIPLTGGCGTANATGTITVAPMDELSSYNGVPCGAFIAPGEWRTFMCRNLGADPTADPFIPSFAINGDYYQWGQPTPAGTRDGIIGTWGDTYNVSLFYGDNNSANTDAKVKSATDPCPAGYRVPTYDEWQGVCNTTLNPRTNHGTWSLGEWSGAKFGDNLFLPAAGYRYAIAGALDDVGTAGSYWSSLRGAYNMYFNSTVARVNSSSRANGQTVRCIADPTLLNLGACSLTSGDENLAVCQGTAITNIVYAITDATDASVVGLPTGVTGAYVGGNVTISGTPTVTGTFNYTVKLSDGTNWEGCTSGTITVSIPCAAGTFPATVGSSFVDITVDVDMIGSIPVGSTSPTTTTTLRFLTYNLGANPAISVKDQMRYFPVDPQDITVYGGFYQWGRKNIDHTFRCNPDPDVATDPRFTQTIVTDLSNDPGQFVYGGPGSPIAGNSYNWYTHTAASSLWGNGGGLATQANTTYTAGQNTENPCPAGYRVPTQHEWALLGQEGGSSATTTDDSFVTTGNIATLARSGLYWVKVVSGRASFAFTTTGNPMCGYALYNKTEWEGAATGYQDGSLDLFDAA
ncbi:MAG: hypothetical protein FWD09_06105, partial [Lentimicrobiaceae bacterium]|nr:hypothetical protein [Lentimicrobiaceae bacterium]